MEIKRYKKLRFWKKNEVISYLKLITRGKVHFKKEYNSIKEYIDEFNKIKQDSETFCKSFLDEK